MDHLTPLDAGFLQAEDSDPHISVVTGAVIILEGLVPTQEAFRKTMAARLDAIPHGRQIVRGFPFDLGTPLWVDDPNFDLSRHVRRALLPAPGDDAALYRFVEQVMARRFDRAHAMWECWVIEGLAHSRWAILVKMHHCMADGLPSTPLFESIFDHEGQARTLTITRTVPEPEASLTQRLADLIALSFSPRRQLELVTRYVLSPTWLARTSLKVARGVIGFTNELLTGSSTQVLTVPDDRRRQYTAARVSMADIRLINEAFGGNVNDVALAAIAGALRTALYRHGQVPAADSVRSVVPASAREESDIRFVDNGIAIVVPNLPVDLADPVARLHAVQKRLDAHKAISEFEAGQTLTTIAERWPAAPVGWSTRLATRFPQRTIVAITTNVPGPRQPRKVMGRRVLDILPFAPLGLRLRISIALFSYADRLTFGVDADCDTLPDVGEIATSIEAEISLLTAAASRRRTNA
ncbi:MAG: wax ester/triacylglycerol synthase family O-acyltransferase [Nocardiaceae bacterium]|nr:wax ester/triacylglycerol synthase family O-acyltransferase [Nocardiaceae bacterium]